MKQKSLAFYWSVLGTISLIFAGFLTLALILAKVPIFKELLPSIDHIRWVLVVHVVLSSVVWFTAIPAALTHRILGQSDERPPGFFDHWYAFGFVTSLIGTVLIATAFLRPGDEVILANYIPVLTHPRFLIGLVLYLFGVLTTWLGPLGIVPRMGRVNRFPGSEATRFGLWIGGIFFLFSIVTFLLDYRAVNSYFPNMPRASFYEMAMWGGGHLLQHFSAVFLVIAWIVLISAAYKKELFTRKSVFPVFAVLGLPLLVTPWIWSQPVVTGVGRMAFTQMMRWGIAPGVLLFLILLWRKRTALIPSMPSLKWWKCPELIAVFWSAWLIVLGMVFGSFIRGDDLRVPGHYHATIGAITIVYMVIGVRFLTSWQSEVRWLKPALWVYGTGQTVFSSGFFIAGAFGVARKSYGEAAQLEGLGQYFGFFTFATGGLIALVGGLLFGLAYFSAVSPIVSRWFSGKTICDGYKKPI